MAGEFVLEGAFDDRAILEGFKRIEQAAAATGARAGAGMEDALNRYGKRSVAALQQELDRLGGRALRVNVDSSAFEKAQRSIAKVRALLDEVERKKIAIEYDAGSLGRLQAELSRLQQKQTRLSVDSSEFKDVTKQIAGIESQIDAANKKRIAINVDPRSVEALQLRLGELQAKQVKLDVDSSEFKDVTKQIAAVQAQIDTTNQKRVAINVDPKSVEALQIKLSELQAKQVKLDIDSTDYLQAAKEIQAVEARIDAANQKRISIDVDQKSIRALQTELASLQERQLKLNVNTSEFKQVTQQIAAVEAQIDSANRKRLEINADTKTIDGLRTKLSGLQSELDKTAIGSRRFYELRDSVKGLERELDLATGKMNLLSLAGKAVAGYLSFQVLSDFVRSLASVSMQAESAEVRLQALSGRFNETAQAQEIVAAAAKTLNLSQIEASNGFSQLYAALRPSGVSLQQIEDIFVGVTAASKNMGLSAQGVQNALYQLTQGLASGRLQGEELRSVLEQLPPLSQAIASTMGVSVGALRDLGAQGKITTEVIAKAVETLKKQELGGLDKTLGTTAERVKALSNAWQAFQVDLGQNLLGLVAKGAGSLASALQFATDNTRGLVKTFAFLGTFVGTLAALANGAWLVAKAQKAAAVAAAAFQAIMNPANIAKVALALGAAVGVTVLLDKAMGSAGESTAQLGEQVKQTESMIAKQKEFGLDTGNAQERLRELQTRIVALDEPIQIKAETKQAEDQISALKKELSEEPTSLAIKAKIEGLEDFKRFLSQLNSGQPLQGFSASVVQAGARIAELKSRLIELTKEKIALPLEATANRAKIQKEIEKVQAELDKQKLLVSIELQEQNVQEAIKRVQALLTQKPDSGFLKAEMDRLLLQQAELNDQKAKQAALDKNAADQAGRSAAARLGELMAQAQASQTAIKTEQALSDAQKARLEGSISLLDAIVARQQAAANLEQAGTDVLLARNQYLQGEVKNEAERARLKKEQQALEAQALAAQITGAGQKFQAERQSLDLKQKMAKLEQDMALIAAQRAVNEANLAYLKAQQAGKTGEELNLAKAGVDLANGQLGIEQQRAGLLGTTQALERDTLNLNQQTEATKLRAQAAGKGIEQSLGTQLGLLDQSLTREGQRASYTQKLVEAQQNNVIAAKKVADAEQAHLNAYKVLDQARRSGDPKAIESAIALVGAKEDELNKARGVALETARQVGEQKAVAEQMQRSGIAADDVLGAVRGVRQEQGQLSTSAGSLGQRYGDAARQAGGITAEIQGSGKEARILISNVKDVGRISSTAAGQAKTIAQGLQFSARGAGAITKSDFSGQFEDASFGAEAISGSGIDTVIGRAAGQTQDLTYGMSRAAAEAETFYSWLARASGLPNARWAGGPVEAGAQYRVNELGQEAFLANSGRLALINRAANSTWTAPSSGVVIPAGLTSQLQEQGMIGSTVARNVSQARPARSGNGDLAASVARQSLAIAQLSAEVKELRRKDWSVNVKVRGDGQGLNYLQQMNRML